MRYLGLLYKFSTFLIILWCFFTHNALSKTYNQEEQAKDSLLIEIREDFNEINRQYRDKATALLDTFEILWLSDQFSQPQKETIINTFASFKNMRLRVWPDISLYIETLVEVKNTNNPDKNFLALHDGFNDWLNVRDQRRFLSFLEKTLLLFKKNYLFEARTVKWKFSHDDYYMEFDSVIKVSFDKDGDLIGYSMYDSIVVRQTTGTFYLLDDVWKGNYGKYTWKRVNVDPDYVFAEFDKYSIDLSLPRFSIDSVRFYNFYYFSHPLLGELHERMVSDIRPENARYPRFNSYQAIHEITDLFPNIDYVGGFTMSGQRVLGTAADDQMASIKIYRNDSLFVTARAETFSIRHDRINSRRAAVSVHIAGDSVYHPGIEMRYLHEKNEFSLTRDEQGISRAPFQNTYHKMDMYCEAMYWDIEKSIIEFKTMRGIGDRSEAVFESNDFFSELRFIRLQGIDNIHPLGRLARYSRERNSRKFSIKDYARHIRVDPNSVKTQLINFSYFGFLSIEPDDETVSLNDRLFHYIGAYSGNNDFDALQISSNAPVNAEVNLHNFDMKIHGVKRIPLSDAKNVMIHPYGQTITMQKNRDIYFHGRIESGLFDFYGKEFLFNYDDFRIDLINTDSMTFSVRSHEPDARGQYSLVRVRTVLEGINGELFIDHPENKSGNLPYPRYPIFNSDNESFVYYDREFIQDGVYRREDLYFKITPFSIDSLDHATTENIAFDGVFVSNGIFPDIYDYLTVQPDYSLGFLVHTPEEGYPVYEGKARYNGPVNMSYEGLKANGQLKFLNATVQVKEMLMYLDSARADVDIFTIEEQSEPIKFPSVYASNVDMLYLPADDKLTVNHIDKPIDIFDGLAKIKGGITVSPKGLDGHGDLEIFDGRMISDNYIFHHDEMESSNTTLIFETPTKERINLKLNNYETLVDVYNRKGKFKASDETSYIDMPINRYVSFMDKLHWDHEQKQMIMHNQRGRNRFDLEDLSPEELIDTDFSGYEFISLHGRQDSLSFYVDSAIFDQQASQISARGVNIIKVADAAIFPNNQQIYILPDAEIPQLRNASLIADTNTRFHHFYNAEINIASKNHYRGNAWYDYYNETGEAQALFFEKIDVDNNGQTFGLSNVYKENNFFVTSRFPFKGEINLTADQKHFNYKGATSIIAENCGLLQPTWFRFEAVLSPDSIMIPVGEQIQDANYNEIRAAVMLAGDSIHVYPAIFSRRRHHLDHEIISSKGYLTFNRIINNYVITTKEKHENNDLPDNLIRINPRTCELRGKGDIKFHTGMGQMKTESFGNVIYDLKENDLELDIVMTLDFHFADDCLEILKDSIAKTPHLSSVNLNRQKYIKSMYNIFGVEQGSKLLSEIESNGTSRRLPPELNNTFIFADIRLQWDQQNRAFVSSGLIGLGNVKRTPINKYVNGFFEYQKQRGGDVLTLYFEPVEQLGSRPGGLWFFFSYNRGVMQAISSVSDYNNIIRDVRPRRRRLEGDRGVAPYVYVLSPDYLPFSFFDKMKNLYN